MNTASCKPVLILGLCLAVSPSTALSFCSLGSRPALPGAHPVEVELLEDSFLRKSGRRYGCSRVAAQKAIFARYQTGRGFLQGHMAEAMYIHRNPGWRYVQSPTATQNDAFRFVPGRQPPITAQVKFHQNGRPSDYARDMRNDHLATRFAIPDDHVQPTKSYLRQQAQRAEIRGETRLASMYWRDHGRVRGMGFSSSDVIEATTRAARFSKSGAGNPYIAFGAVVGGTLLPNLRSQRNEAIEGLAASFVDGIAIKATDDLLKRSKPSVLTRGKGALVILGSVVTISNTAFLANQYGFRNALKDGNFYLELGGSTTGLAGATLAGWGMTEFLPASLAPSPFMLFAATTVVGYGSFEAYWQMVKLYRLWRDPSHFHRDFLKQAEDFRGHCLLLEANLTNLDSAETRNSCDDHSN